MTIFYGVLHRDGRLSAASAGHLPPLTCSEGPHYLDVPPGVPIGVEGDPRGDVLDVRPRAGQRAGRLLRRAGRDPHAVADRGAGGGAGALPDAAGGTPAEIVAAPRRAMVETGDTGGGSGGAVDDDVTVLGLRLR